MAMSFEPAGYHTATKRRRPRSLHPMTRRQDSQQRKTNSLQSSSGFAISLYNGFSSGTCSSARSTAPSCALRRPAPAGVKIAWSATTLLAVRRPPPHRPPPSGHPSTLRSFASQPWAPLHRVATPYIREVRARCRCTGSVEE